jgi:hypothetical protein
MGSEWILGRLAGGVVEWIQLAHDRDRKPAMNLRALSPRSELAP